MRRIVAVCVLLASLAVIAAPAAAGAGHRRFYPIGKHGTCVAGYMKRSGKHEVRGKRVRYWVCVEASTTGSSTSTTTEAPAATSRATGTTSTTQVPTTTEAAPSSTSTSVSGSWTKTQGNYTPGDTEEWTGTFIAAVTPAVPLAAGALSFTVTDPSSEISGAQPPGGGPTTTFVTEQAGQVSCQVTLSGSAPANPGEETDRWTWVSTDCSGAGNITSSASAPWSLSVTASFAEPGYPSSSSSALSFPAS